MNKNVALNRFLAGSWQWQRWRLCCIAAFIIHINIIRFFIFKSCLHSAATVTDELQFNKALRVFNIHLVRCYLSSEASIQGWKRKRKDGGKRGRGEENHGTKSVMRCWFMVHDVRAHPHEGLCPPPVHVIFHLDHQHLPPSPSTPTLPLQPCAAHPKNLPSLHLSEASRVSPILLSFPWLDSEPWFWCRLHGCRGIHPPRFPGNGPGAHANPCYELCQLTAVWLFVSPQQSGHGSTLSELSSGGVTCVSLPIFCCWLQTSKSDLTSTSLY